MIAILIIAAGIGLNLVDGFAPSPSTAFNRNMIYGFTVGTFVAILASVFLIVQWLAKLKR